MKNHEEFRASVYARAECEKQALAARRLKARNASLSVAMVLLVAALAVPFARNAQTGLDTFTPPEVTQEVRRTANRAAAQSPRTVLLVAAPSGETKAEVLENNDQRKAFANHYRAVVNMEEGEGTPFSAERYIADIRSADEMTEFLAELPEVAEVVGIDYDEVFFADKNLNLYVMPMEQAAQSARAEDAPTQLHTVPDTTIPDAPLPLEEDATAPFTEEEAAPDPTAPAMQMPDNGLLQGSDVKMLVFVPVSKG